MRSDSEFYLINEHMDYLINMGAPDEETELFDSMLFDYEERARKRREKREKQKKEAISLAFFKTAYLSLLRAFNQFVRGIHYKLVKSSYFAFKQVLKGFYDGC